MLSVICRRTVIPLCDGLPPVVSENAVSPAPTFLLTAQINPHHRETTGAQHGCNGQPMAGSFGDSAWTCSLPASPCCTLVHGLVQEIAANIDDAELEAFRTLRDLELWLFKILRLPHYHRSRSTCVKNWNVIDKIQRAKLADTFHSTINGEDYDFCGQVLAAVSPSATAKRTAREAESQFCKAER
ncbi:MAG: hypothetical protein Q7J21_01950, partial [Rugosibacter sp.]|nr:hypothetical protein [Rugosibacter sp.]